MIKASDLLRASLVSAAVIAPLLWLLSRLSGGDAAAILGALAVGVLPPVFIALYLLSLLDKEQAVVSMDAEQFDVYLRRQVAPGVQDFVIGLAFTQTVITGTWIGVFANHPAMVAIAASAVWVMAVKALRARFALDRLLLIVATLLLATGMGQGLRYFALITA